jgi:hypothetical protein
MQPGRIALLAAVLCGLSTVPAHAATGSKDVLPDMVLHHLAHMSARSMAPNAANALQQVVLFANCVTHDVPKAGRSTPLYFDPHLLM